MCVNFWTRQLLFLLIFYHSSRCTDGHLLERERLVHKQRYTKEYSFNCYRRSVTRLRMVLYNMTLYLT